MTEMNTIKCPCCGKELNIDEIYMDQMRQRFEAMNNTEMEKAKEEQEKKMQLEFQKRMDDAVEAIKKEHDQKISSLVNQNELLEKANIEQNKQMLEFQKKEFELRQEAKNAELEAQKKLNSMTEELYEKAKKDVGESKDLEIAKLQKKLEDANKATEDVKKKLEQGSQQLTGEIQELRLEDCLREEFPSDTIEDIAKGKNGADVIQTVVNESGKICGKIVWESKNVKNWKKEFIPKLRGDMERVNGDIGILVSHVFGKNMNEFTMENGVWLVRPQNALSMARLVRERVIALSDAKALIEKKETIQDEVYAFVTSPQFRNRIENIGRQYRALDEEISKTKDAMERHWSTQRKLIDDLVSNTQGIIGEVDSFMITAENSPKELGQPIDPE